jgi:hypothetical protein
MKKIKRPRYEYKVAKYATDLEKKYMLPKISTDDFFNICPYSFNDLLKKNRKRDLIEWRAIYFSICFIQLKNYTSVQKFIKTFERTTILHAIKSLEIWYDYKDVNVLEKLSMLSTEIQLLNVKPKCNILFIETVTPKKQFINYE